MIGQMLGPYLVLERVGAGGMGEVYRAKDTRLDRLVAVKVLPRQLSADPELRQRFDREARAISSLNHPHICALYDVGETAAPEPTRFLVMELLAGESLASRLLRGPLPLAEAIACGIEIAGALHSAHRHGIVHRDLKPGNVMLTKAGAKLLDFGLAKSGAPLKATSHHAETALAPTSHDLTTQGTIVGTIQYMAPEQLEGQEADARTDVFAFGATLFEMITGRRAFGGRTQASLIGAILRDHPPPVSSLVTVTPAALDRVIAKCLAKDPDDRWQDASDLQDELRWLAEGASSTTGGPSPARGRGREWVAWALFATALITAGLLAIRGPRAPSPPRVVRFTISPPEGVTFAPSGAPVAPFPAVSPDGTRLVFVANRAGEAPSLWVRSLDSLDAQQLPDTTVRTDTLSPGLPFWSPDSLSVGFFADGKLKRVRIDGGAPQTICDAPQSGGAAWGPDGTIVFASRIDEGISKVPAGGGAPIVVTRPDAARGEISHSHPAFLPDGRHFLYWIQAPRPAIAVGSIDSSTTKYLFESDSRAVFGSGYVFFVRQSTLFAQPFDPVRLETSGEPLPVSEDVRTFGLNGRSAFSVSANGVLVYRRGTVRAAQQLAWHDRQGKPLASIRDSTAAYDSFSLAPNERHLIAEVAEGNVSDLWLIDLEQGTRSRITSAARSEGSPVFSPDGQYVVFASNRNGNDDLFRKRADGVGEERLLHESSAREYPTDWSRHWIAFSKFDPTRKQDLWVLGEDGTAKPYLQTEFSESDGRLSPDERWMAYTSDEAGPSAVYLRTFPDADGGKWRVSGAGSAFAPQWRSDGKEIFYIGEGGQLIAVPVQLDGRTPVVNPPRPLFQPTSVTRYAVSRDGSRILLAVRGSASTADTPLSVVLNWREELQQRVPTR